MEVIQGNVEHPVLDELPLADGGFECLIKFRSLKEARNMTLSIVVDGHEIRLWHRGRYQCKICDEQGHTEDYHAEFVRAIARNKAKRSA